MKEKPLVVKNLLFRFCSNLFFYCIAAPILIVLDFFWFGFRIRGRQNLRGLRGSGGVVVCNHVHNFDCTFVGLSVLPRRAVFTSLEYLFRVPVVGPLIRLMGSVPVPADLSGMRRFLTELSGEAERGRLVCIYPEGLIEPYCGHLRDFRDGAFSVAVRGNVPVVPLVLSTRPQRGIWRLKRRPCFTMEIGRPLYPAQEGSTREKTKDLSRRTRAVMEDMQERNQNPPAGRPAAPDAGEQRRREAE